jgi:hypothetical protein
MSTIVTDKAGQQWLPAYTAFNKVMGKNALVIPFRTVFIDGAWWKVGEVDVEREAYPVESMSIEEWIDNPDPVEVDADNV